MYQSKHKSQHISGLARDSTGDPISLYSQKPKHRKRKTKVSYGITSLTPEEASVERLLELRRGHWAIENKSHWMRDTQLGEATSAVRCGAIPQVMAALRNTALAVFRNAGVTQIADTMKYYASKPKLAVNLIN